MRLDDPIPEGGHLTGLQPSAYLSDSQVRQNHRRAVLRQIILPVALTGVAMIAVLVILILALSPRMLNVAASFMSLLILIPTVLVCLVPYVLIVAAFAGTRKLYFLLPGQLRAARHFMHRANDVARNASFGVARPVIAVSRRLAWVEQLVSRKPPRALSAAKSKALIPSTSGESKSNER